MEKELSYKQAMAEAEKILDSLNKEDFDIDTLAQKVKTATALLAQCRQRLLKAEADLEEVISQEN